MYIVCIVESRVRKLAGLTHASVGGCGCVCGCGCDCDCDCDCGCVCCCDWAVLRWSVGYAEDAVAVSPACLSVAEVLVAVG